MSASSQLKWFKDVICCIFRTMRRRMLSLWRLRPTPTPTSCSPNPQTLVRLLPKGRHKRESKNAKQMRNTKQNCFSHSSASPLNYKQCSAKQCFANQTNRCLASFASRSDLFRDNARFTKHRRKVHNHVTWDRLLIGCFTHVSLKTWFSNQAMFFFCFGVTQMRNRKCAKPFCFLILVSCFLTLVCGGPKLLLTVT